MAVRCVRESDREIATKGAEKERAYRMRADKEFERKIVQRSWSTLEYAASVSGAAAT